MKVLILGASGGIGKALANILAHRDGVETVYASYYKTNPQIDLPGVESVQLDATNETQVKALLAMLPPLNAIINCIGFLHEGAVGPEKSIKRFDPALLTRNIQLNTLPTALVAKYARPLLQDAASPVFATLSARVGSIEENALGGWYSYRVSKAALNMLLKTLSIEWRLTIPRCTVAALHPGTVATDLSAPFRGGSKNVFSPQQSAEHLLAVIDGLTPENSGKFWSWDGSQLPW